MRAKCKNNSNTNDNPWNMIKNCAKGYKSLLISTWDSLKPMILHKHRIDQGRMGHRGKTEHGTSSPKLS